MNHDLTLTDSRTAVLTALKQLGHAWDESWSYAGKALSAGWTFALTLLSLCFLTLGALALKVNQFTHDTEFGVHKEAA